MTTVLKHLTAKVLNSNAIAITLEMTNPAWMRGSLKFLGASMRASADPGAYCSSFVLYPEKDVDGIFAVLVEEEHKQSGPTGKRHPFVTMHREGYFLQVCWQDGKPRAVLSEPYFPTKRIGQVYGAGVSTPRVEVTLPNGMGASSTGDVNKPYVDGNLLCRYLASVAHTHDVLHALVQEKLEPTRTKVIDEMQRKIRQQESYIRKLEEDNRTLTFSVKRLVIQATRAQISLSELVSRFQEKADALATWCEQIKPFLPGWLRQSFFGKYPEMPKVCESIEGSQFYLSGTQLENAKRDLAEGMQKAA